jgi:hypothetical protein
VPQDGSKQNRLGDCSRVHASAKFASIAALTGHVYGMPELVHEVREGRVTSRIGEVKSERNLPLAPM